MKKKTLRIPLVMLALSFLAIGGTIYQKTK